MSFATNILAKDRLHFNTRRHVPLILQTEAAECGLACLAMIACYFKYETDLTRLRQRFAISSHGATLKQVMDIAAQLQLGSRALKLDLDDLSQLETPCILHWELKHFVVLTAVNKHHITILDPALGERKVFWPEVDNCFTGIALELSPTPQFIPHADKNQLRFSHFWCHLHGLKRSLVIIFSLSLMLQLFALLSPFYMQIVVDEVIATGDTHLLVVLALGFSLLLLIEMGTSILRQLVTLQVSNSLSLQMASNVFNHLIRLPLNYFSKRHVGDIVSRFGSLTTIRQMLTTGMIAVFLDGLMAIITLVVMYAYNTMLASLVLGVVGLYALLRALLFRPIRRLNEEAIAASARESSHFMESLRGAQTIKLFGQESQRQSQWLNRLADSMNKQIQISRWNIGFGAANQLLFGLENILLISLAAHAVMDNILSIGMVYAFISYKTRFVGAMDGLISQWIEFKMLGLHFDRLADIVFTEQDPQLKTTDLGNCLVELSGEITLENVSYRYAPQEPLILNNINLHVNAGETIAIIGASGCGKTTLLKCMMGLIPLSSGFLRMDGQAPQNVSNFRQQIGAVMQDDRLLSGSIADNIAGFADKVDFAAVKLAAQAAGIANEIEATAMQYQTLINDMGCNFSGGQKQRLVLARALYREPKILFLDEATSHLDGANEANIQANLDRLNITRIIAAHRLSTLRNADRIYELVDGVLHPVDAHDLTSNSH
ncbi:peptidase domain-containing ABC transporter [Alteromonas sp. ASW11-36]|uniref:Peptidase domain-containing ABC transporter n=1 Tax=Alteromonas arenosi TaxID=3055817 RepID=A0ABT7SYR1_9ALTE|nr:peptidase domain-containing ABC transporter [Alteromonas sp. ASW11-36]MDM7861327.1 peptidase domain-containing ABC transporter [Alteromonas sp. ASW11-36]